MLIDKAASVTPQQVQEGTRIRWLLTAEEGAPNFAMRVIEIDPGVVFEPHQHPFEHEIYVLEGTGMLTNPNGDVGELVPDTFVLVPSDEVHGYRNTGGKVLKFICVIPLQN